MRDTSWYGEMAAEEAAAAGAAGGNAPGPQRRSSAQGSLGRKPGSKLSIGSASLYQPHLVFSMHSVAGGESLQLGCIILQPSHVL